MAAMGGPDTWRMSVESVVVQVIGVCMAVGVHWVVLSCVAFFWASWCRR
jgi:hypothetical protein